MNNDSTFAGKAFHIEVNDSFVDETLKLIIKDKEVFFKQDESIDDSLVFINITHDFPLKISHRFILEDSIQAYVTDEKKNRLNSG